MPKIYYNKKIPADENTLALLHFDESVTKDECGNNWTTSGSPTISTAQSKFGGKAVFFSNTSATTNNSGSYLSCDDGITLGGQDFTIDLWAWWNSSNNTWARLFCIFDTTGTHANSIELEKVGADSQTGFFINDVQGTGAPFTTKVWNHYALVYTHATSTATLYVNGVARISLSISVPQHTYKHLRLAHGQYSVVNTNYFGGYIDEFRISNIARWTADFTPPTEPYAGIGTKSIELWEVN